MVRSPQTSEAIGMRTTGAITFAWQLGRHSIDVLLTIQMETIAKPGQKPIRIPSNVESAINFYQSDGPLHGRNHITASEGARTKIIGNV